jgi:putative membrane protein
LSDAQDAAGLPRRPARRAAPRAALLLAVTTVLVQIGHPLLSGTGLRLATVLAVLLFAAASLTDAAGRFSPAVALRVLAVAGGLGLLAEALGVATGVPFGRYRYAGTLGPSALGVPLLVPLAWTMMAYPCLLLGRRLARHHHRPVVRRAVAVAAGAGTLAGWDLYLDPQMVAAGHWTWAHPVPALPGVGPVPLTNTAGWLLVAAVMVLALDLAVPAVPAVPVPDGAGGPDDAVPAVLLGWTWLGSGLANLAFFDRPAVALYGLVAMGVTTAPYLWSLLGPLPGLRLGPRLGPVTDRAHAGRWEPR